MGFPFRRGRYTVRLSREFFYRVGSSNEWGFLLDRVFCDGRFFYEGGFHLSGVSISIKKEIISY